jgi:hypothetical protein
VTFRRKVMCTFSRSKSKTNIEASRSWLQILHPRKRHSSRSHLISSNETVFQNGRYTVWAKIETIPLLGESSFYIQICFLICAVGIWVLRPLTGLLYQPRMIGDGDCGELGGMNFGRGYRSTRRKPTQRHFCPSQNSA